MTVVDSEGPCLQTALGTDLAFGPVAPVEVFEEGVLVVVEERAFAASVLDGSGGGSGFSGDVAFAAHLARNWRVTLRHGHNLANVKNP